jgi:HD-GYP domain-containing protein (c-di-GMP phosphodiesterase class II)
VKGSRPEDRIRLAELIASLSLATDLGLGQPFERELGVGLAALELADRLGCGARERGEVYYVSLLAHVGCTAAAGHLASWAGGDEIRFQQAARVLGPAAEPAEVLPRLVRRLAEDRPLPERARLVARQLVGGGKQFQLMAADLCEGASMLAHRLGMSEGVCRALGQLMSRWDGKGAPAGAAGEDIPRSLRIVRVAHDLVALAQARDPEAAAAALRRRRGRGYDPEIVDAALAEPGALLRAAAADDAWERVIAAEPEPVATVASSGLETLARAFGEFVDLKVGFLRGHSSRVAALAAAGTRALGHPGTEAAEVRVAGLLHDLGRVAVPNGIWEKRGALTASEWERVRLHPYYTRRVLEHSPALAPLAATAGSHHERLDGSGYHLGAAGAQLSAGARLLAAADVYDAITHDRPYRPARSAAEARRELGGMVRGGLLDKRAVDAILSAAGGAPLGVRQAYPAGLTEREAEVLRLLAQGRTNREIAGSLVITEKTAGHHVAHIYHKIGVSTRAGAALFAMRHDLTE